MPPLFTAVERATGKTVHELLQEHLVARAKKCCSRKLGSPPRKLPTSSPASRRVGFWRVGGVSEYRGIKAKGHLLWGSTLDATTQRNGVAQLRNYVYKATSFKTCRGVGHPHYI